jgi:hypothetical protein
VCIDIHADDEGDARVEPLVHAGRRYRRGDDEHARNAGCDAVRE